MANLEAERVVAQQFELMSEGKPTEVAALFAEDATNFGRQVGRSGFEATLRALGEAFPDQRWEIVEMVSDGEMVTCRTIMRGTHLGQPSRPMVLGGVLAGVEPTGRRVEVNSIHMFRVRDGKLTEHFAVRDDLGMGRQLGLLPEAPVTGAQ
jgi:predicted ester cyclase